MTRDVRAPCVALFSAGDMGHAVGAVCVQRGLRVLTSLSGRSELTRSRAERVGIVDAGSIAAAIAEADLVLSIMPPSRAEAFAGELADLLGRQDSKPSFADCNAVSPETAKRMQQTIEARGGSFIDAGIIGAPPGKNPAGPRFYASGAHADRLEAIDGESEHGKIEVRVIGDDVGRASGLKMVYAGLTKGTMTLHAAVLITAQRLGLLDDLTSELQASQTQAWGRMAVLPFLPADAGRWIGEMEEIADTFRAAGAPPGFHEAAAEVFRIMAQSPFASETRETLDRSRSLEEAITVFADIAARRGGR
jgi:3-hydroxyisobutyrate dehydrogenase-like beta-hydroxyacid dehydrogenase